MAFALQHAPPAKLAPILEAANVVQQYQAGAAGETEAAPARLSGALNNLLGGKGASAAASFTDALRRASKDGLALAGEALDAARQLSAAPQDTDDAAQGGDPEGGAGGPRRTGVRHVPHPAYAGTRRAFSALGDSDGSAVDAAAHSSYTLGRAGEEAGRDATSQRYLRKVVQHALTAPAAGRAEAVGAVHKALLSVAVAALPRDLALAVSCLVDAGAPADSAALVLEQTEAGRAWRAGQYIAALVLAYVMHPQDFGSCLRAPPADVITWGLSLTVDDEAAAAPWREVLLR